MVKMSWVNPGSARDAWEKCSRGRAAAAAGNGAGFLRETCCKETHQTEGWAAEVECYLGNGRRTCPRKDSERATSALLRFRKASEA